MKPAPSALLERALDMLEHALVIVDAAGELRYRNRLAAALLKGAGPALRRAIRVACAERRPSALLPAQGAQPPLRLVLAPMEGGEAAVWILAPETARLPDPRVLGVLFGLSRAEARLALGLLAGQTPRECAREAGVGVATVRSHLHNIFAKTGARRQAELVALLARVPALGS